ncbi:MAG: heterodisulfide reductase-related iron-sulfur binding cluster [Acidiferrobacterales bacterium]
MDLASKIRHEAGRCVSCGLCLPHCPTYRQMRTENESPRGRIALMRAIAGGDLPVTARLESHLSLCLDCRSCENVCPANVRYGQLIDSARALIETRRPRPRVQDLLRRLLMDQLLARPRNLRLLARALRFYQVSGLQRCARATHLPGLLGLEQWEAQLPPLSRQVPWQQQYPAQAPRRGRVGLLTGCISGIVDHDTLTATIRVLTTIGFDVHVPSRQVCCGALHQHGGEPKKAAALMRRNIEAFGAAELDAIVSTASGCAATLAEYGVYLPDDAGARVFSAKAREVSDFLTGTDWPTTVHCAPLPIRVAVHDPCTLTNVLHANDEPYRLLQRIPALELRPLPENNLCCGAAGVYFLTHSQMAHDLRAPKLASLAQWAPDAVVTTNIGCALHLGQGMRTINPDIKIVHPVILIAKQLQVAGSS